MRKIKQKIRYSALFVLTMFCFFGINSVSAVTFDSCVLFPWTCPVKPIDTSATVELKVVPTDLNLVATTTESDSNTDGVTLGDSVLNVSDDLIKTDTLNTVDQNDPSDLMIDTIDSAASGAVVGSGSNSVGTDDKMLGTKDGAVADSVVVSTSGESGDGSDTASLMEDWFSQFEERLASFGVVVAEQPATNGSQPATGNAGSENEDDEQSGGVTLTESQFQKLEELLNDYRQELENRKNQAEENNDSEEIVGLLDDKLAVVDKYLDRVESVREQLKQDDNSETLPYVIGGLALILLVGGTTVGIWWWKRSRGV